MSNEIARDLRSTIKNVVNGREYATDVENEINDILVEFSNEYNLGEEWFYDYGFETAYSAYLESA